MPDGWLEITGGMAFDLVADVGRDRVDDSGTQVTALLKPRPHALVKADRKAALKAKDEAENAKVRKRSRGQCEVVGVYGSAIPDLRCQAKAMPQSHHLIYGSGRRNVGKSILAECRQAVCKRCSDLIHQHILVPVPGCDRERAASVRYQRVR